MLQFEPAWVSSLLFQTSEEKMQKRTATGPPGLYIEVTCLEGVCVNHLPIHTSTGILKNHGIGSAVT